MQSPMNMPWMVWELASFLRDEKRVQQLLEAEEHACLLDSGHSDDKARRWWHYHKRLRSGCASAPACDLAACAFRFLFRLRARR